MTEPPRNAQARTPPRGRARVAIAIVIAGLASPAGAREECPVVVVPAPDRPRVAEEIRHAMARHDSASAFPLPELEEEQLGRLFDGEVVRMREKWVLSNEGEDEERTRNRVLAFRLVGAPRRDAWLAALDPHALLNDRVTEIRLGESPEGGATWYQFMDLPWPIRNRHWVIRIATALDVCAGTGGQCWEQTWHLVPGGEAVARSLAAKGRAGPLDGGAVRGARYLEENDGAWAIFAIGDDLTLVAYNLTIVMGGWIPEGMAARFAQRALEDLLDRVAAHAARIPTHYVAGHAPIPAGDGTPIPVYPAETSAAR
jgi:hypothetical protein